MKHSTKGIFLFIFIILFGNILFVSAQESNLNNSVDKTKEMGFLTSLEHWIVNFSDKLWENVRELAGKMFDTIFHPSEGLSRSSTSQGAYHQAQKIASGGW